MDNTSAHVHIGMQILGNNPKYWRNFAKLWMTYENIIFRFMYGEYVSPRNEIEKYSKPIKEQICKAKTIEEMLKIIDDFKENN